MQEFIDIEKQLFGEVLGFSNSNCVDSIFFLERIVGLPKYRPFSLDCVIELSQRFFKDSEFKMQLLELASVECPVLVYRLFKLGAFTFEEIREFLNSDSVFILLFYFRRIIENFNDLLMMKKRPDDFDDYFVEDESKIDDYLEYGFLSSSIEFCLKYDEIDVLKSILSVVPNMYQNTLKWSPFEWSKRPDSLSLLSFSGFFGSIRCFRQILMSGFVIDDYSRESITKSGVSDLFQQCNCVSYDLVPLVKAASESCQLGLLRFLIEHGASVNAQYWDD